MTRELLFTLSNRLFVVFFFFQVDGSMHKIDPPLPQRKKSIKVIYESQLTPQLTDPRSLACAPPNGAEHQKAAFDLP
jgi:hypothetical protein